MAFRVRTFSQRLSGNLSIVRNTSILLPLSSSHHAHPRKTSSGARRRVAGRHSLGCERTAAPGEPGCRGPNAVTSCAARRPAARGPRHLCPAGREPLRFPCALDRQDGRGAGHSTRGNHRVARRVRRQLARAHDSGTDAVRLSDVRPQPPPKAGRPDRRVAACAGVAKNAPASRVEIIARFSRPGAAAPATKRCTAMRSSRRSGPAAAGISTSTRPRTTAASCGSCRVQRVKTGLRPRSVRAIHRRRGQGVQRGLCVTRAARWFEGIVGTQQARIASLPIPFGSATIRETVRTVRSFPPAPPPSPTQVPGFFLMPMRAGGRAEGRKNERYQVRQRRLL